MYLYSVSKDGVEIYQGTSKQLYHKFQIITSNYRLNKPNGVQVDGIYHVKKVGVYEPPIKEVKAKVDKEEEKKNYYIKHLAKYGNTVVRKVDEKHIPKLLKELKEWGYECNITEYKHYNRDIRLDGSRSYHRQTGSDFILELKK